MKKGKEFFLLYNDIKVLKHLLPFQFCGECVNKVQNAGPKQLKEYLFIKSARHNISGQAVVALKCPWQEVKQRTLEFKNNNFC